MGATWWVGGGRSKAPKSVPPLEQLFSLKRLSHKGFGRIVAPDPLPPHQCPPRMVKTVLTFLFLETFIPPAF